MCDDFLDFLIFEDATGKKKNKNSDVLFDADDADDDEYDDE